MTDSGSESSSSGECSSSSSTSSSSTLSRSSANSDEKSQKGNIKKKSDVPIEINKKESPSKSMKDNDERNPPKEVHKEEATDNSNAISKPDNEGNSGQSSKAVETKSKNTNKDEKDKIKNNSRNGVEKSYRTSRSRSQSPTKLRKRQRERRSRSISRHNDRSRRSRRSESLDRRREERKRRHAAQEDKSQNASSQNVANTADNESVNNPKALITEKQRRTVDLLTSRTGGAYIPPAKLRLLQAEITDKSSAAYQRIAWEALKKSIHGYINKVNVFNIAIITRELLKENIVRGRGLLCRSIVQAQAASPTFTHVYAALVAIINSKFPNIGELLLRRLIIQFKRAFRRNDKGVCISASRFIAHLVNQRVAHEILALEILTLLVEKPTDDSIEVSIAFLRECGMKLTEVTAKGVGAIFEMLKNILHEGKLEKRVQYMIEVIFQVRKDGFKDHQAVADTLELVEEDDQYTHLLMLEEATDPEDGLNVFKYDEKYESNEGIYNGLSKEILGSDSDESGSSDGSGSNSENSSDTEGGDGDGDGKENADTIIDNTETNLIALRRTIYLTINSSLDYEECAHKLMKMQLKPGQEIELCHMFLDCCAEQRTYEKFYGLLAQRFCAINKIYIEPFEEIFRDTYHTTHRLDTNRLRNVAKFFAHLLFTDAISWDVLECIKLNEDDTTSSSRIFIKILFQELAEYMGLSKLNGKLQDVVLVESLAGLFPKDNPRNTRFAINFFTSIGLGGLTDELRQFLKTAPKSVPAINAEILANQLIKPEKSSSSSSTTSSSDSDSSSSSESSTDSSNSSSSSSDSESDSSDRKKRKVKRKKREEIKKHGKSKQKKVSKEKNKKRKRGKNSTERIASSGEESEGERIFKVKESKKRKKENDEENNKIEKRNEKHKNLKKNDRIQRDERNDSREKRRVERIRSTTRSRSRSYDRKQYNITRDDKHRNSYDAADKDKGEPDKKRSEKGKKYSLSPDIVRKEKSNRDKNRTSSPLLDEEGVREKKRSVSKDINERDKKRSDSRNNSRMGKSERKQKNNYSHESSRKENRDGDKKRSISQDIGRKGGNEGDRNRSESRDKSRKEKKERKRNRSGSPIHSRKKRSYSLEINERNRNRSESQDKAHKEKIVRDRKYEESSSHLQEKGDRLGKRSKSHDNAYKVRSGMNNKRSHSRSVDPEISRRERDRIKRKRSASRERIKVKSAR